MQERVFFSGQREPERIPGTSVIPLCFRKAPDTEKKPMNVHLRHSKGRPPERDTGLEGLAFVDVRVPVGGRWREFAMRFDLKRAWFLDVPDDEHAEWMLQNAATQIVRMITARLAA